MCVLEKHAIVVRVQSSERYRGALSLSRFSRKKKPISARGLVANITSIIKSISLYLGKYLNRSVLKTCFTNRFTACILLLLYKYERQRHTKMVKNTHI
jgi:hypothetical protein